VAIYLVDLGHMPRIPPQNFNYQHGHNVHRPSSFYGHQHSPSKEIEKLTQRIQSLEEENQNLKVENESLHEKVNATLTVVV